MEQYTITFLPDHRQVESSGDETLLQVQIRAGLRPDAPCGGKGTCGKCTVTVDGRQVLACQTMADRNMTVILPENGENRILTGGLAVDLQADGENEYALAFDIGTTTVVCYLLDGRSGALLAQASTMNPQAQFGADVISRIQEVLDTGTDDLMHCIREALVQLTGQVCSKAGIQPSQVGTAAIVGNTAMHHLLLDIDPKPLVTPPYMPAVFEAMEVDGLLPIGGTVRILPNIAGFVGGDTVGCMASARFDQLEKLTLMIDIGTNGEMVLGNKTRRIACSTAAGPAFEGAKISCGMRGAEGAVDHVWVEDGQVRYHVIGEKQAIGLCGSGLLDLVAVLLDLEIIDESGRLEDKTYRLGDTDVVLTQKDVREVQLAKAAIRAGIELLCQELGAKLSDIQDVLLAGAFGNYLDPGSACRIGMIPPVLLERIRPIGNAAGEGAKLSAVSRKEFEYAKALGRGTDFLELASMPDFQDCYVDALEFEEEEA